MISIRVQLIAASAVVAATVAAVRPRRAEPETVSMDFMLAALSQPPDYNQGPTRPTVLAGKISPILGDRVAMPPGATVLGTITWARATDVYGIASGSPDDVRRWYDDDFTKRRYVTVDQRGISQLRGGFRDADAGPAGGYCSPDGQYYTVSARPRVPAGVDFRVRLTPGGQCGFSMVGGGFIDAKSAPTLFNPPMAQTIQRCFSGYDDIMQRTSSAGISSSMAPQDILAHYQKQLDKLGWKRTNAPSAASATWTKHDTTGSDELLSINITPGTEADCRSLDMRFKEIKK